MREVILGDSCGTVVLGCAAAGVRALKAAEGGTCKLVIGAVKTSGKLRKHWAKLHPVGGASRLVRGTFINPGGTFLSKT